MTELDIEEAIREAWEIFQAGTTASPAARPALCHNRPFIAKFGALTIDLRKYRSSEIWASPPLLGEFGPKSLSSLVISSHNPYVMSPKSAHKIA